MKNNEIKCSKCDRIIFGVQPSVYNGYLSWQHVNRKLDTSHDADPKLTPEMDKRYHQILSGNI